MVLDKFIPVLCLAVVLLLSSRGADHVGCGVNSKPDPAVSTGKKKVISSYVRYNL